VARYREGGVRKAVQVVYIKVRGGSRVHLGKSPPQAPISPQGSSIGKRVGVRELEKRVRVRK
jgi:hypothetical protein